MHKTRRWVATLLIGAMGTFALAAAGCGSSDSKSSTSGGGGGGTSTAAATGGKSKAPGGTVKVGNISSIAGLGGVFSGFQAGVKGYFDYYNANGGIDGTKVELTAIDDAADPGKAAAAARKLVQQDKVLAIVGQASLADAATAKYFGAQGIPVLGGWATSSAYHKPNTNMFVSLEGPNPPYCPLWSSNLAKAEGVKSMAFIAQDFPAATKDADCRITAAKNVGVTVAGPRIDVALTAADYRPAVQRAMKTGADAIYFSTGTDGQLKGIQAGEQLGFKGKYIATQPAGLEQGLAKMASALDNRVLTSGFSLLPSDPDSTNAAFKKGMAQFQPKFKDEITAVSGWAAGKLFADALKAAGADQKAIISWASQQKDYAFGGRQGPVDYTLGSTPNPCTTQLVLKGGKFVRADSAKQPPQFDCGPLLDYKSGQPIAYKQYASGQ